MQNIAEFRIIGRIGSTEIKEKVATLDVAANYGRKVGNEWEDDTHWNRVTCFGKNIERAAKMAKGDLVHITGRIRQSRYDREGQTVYGVDLIVDRLAVIAKNGRPADDDRDGGED
ncbi:single-stranded DNA-binding protein [Sphingobium mellinum]|uniref:single-stranded DNA-binding protein n=1 Tax=Sphingobium mellinum TaxID=1387166 RepID=UPI0030ED8FCC